MALGYDGGILSGLGMCCFQSGVRISYEFAGKHHIVLVRIRLSRCEPEMAKKKVQLIEYI